MEPTLKENDVVLVNKVAFFFTKPRIGDMIVVRKEKKRYLVKRITKINEQKYFVMGDNDKQSTDSRNFGWIQKKDIVGKAYVV